MNIPAKENVVSTLEKHFETKLFPVKGKRIFYRGYKGNYESLIVCTPQSKLYVSGFGWVDITTKQRHLLLSDKLGIIAFRLDGGNIYYIHFARLEKYLTNQAMLNNKREGDHWKLRIWPDHIQVIGNKNLLRVKPNDLTEINT